VAHRRPILVIVLKGGLGNQLFQYAAARALADRAGADLAIDAWTGFARDHRYRRRPALTSFVIRGRPASLFDRARYWWLEARRRTRGMPSEPVLRSWAGTFLLESEQRFLPEIHDASWSGTALLDGYWQSERYFIDRPGLRGELTPPAPTRTEALQLGSRMSDEDSVAIGLRLYEEAADPAAHAREGRMKSTAELRNAIHRVLDGSPGRRAYLFCTHRPAILEELRLPAGTTLVTPHEGFADATETLWLLSCCRHHVITNSSLYWWGAWLANPPAGLPDRQVLAADNFINRDAVPARWSKW
jgi:hypothetical protein